MAKYRWADCLAGGTSRQPYFRSSQVASSGFSSHAAPVETRKPMPVAQRYSNAPSRLSQTARFQLQRSPFSKGHESHQAYDPIEGPTPTETAAPASGSRSRGISENCAPPPSPRAKRSFERFQPTPASSDSQGRGVT